MICSSVAEPKPDPDPYYQKLDPIPNVPDPEGLDLKKKSILNFLFREINYDEDRLDYRIE